MKDIKIFYINLDSRNDRNEHMKKILEGYNFERVSAIEDEDGYIGCAKSHIKCIEIARLRKYQKIIILEDDFIFKKNNSFDNIIIPNFEYDILLLCNLIMKKEKINDNFSRVYHSEWTSGHLLNHTIYDDLIKNLQEGIESRLKEGKSRSNNLDIYWNKLIKNCNCICHNKCFATQKEGYSDIQNKNIQRVND